ncbi:metallophosphoesterase family protein [Methanothermococcus okinawensis]|uniref:DNA double-strand break repair protein Mre11 n=1 Tax=Methanothermococcus okinawensis (strain DSM 14208 / JCM 11175 / IH1) TaxID=647113 RepID=F8AKK0_METOI|nr:DNA repair exonuclease [Methanothermococcus okinawensis]AEH07534.1 metallophosphoesterase [Methanothermococcus okinawensis IH1]
MQFVHISDNHLGYRQYNLDERERDFYNSFNECINKIIEIKPDFVIHSGDLFESPEPSINAIYTAMEGFNKLKRYNIPIYIIHGNHDLPKRSSKGSPFRILKGVLGDSLKTFSNKKYHIFRKGNEEIFIGGSDFTYKSKINNLFEDYKLIEEKSKQYNKKILLFHQSVYSYSNLPMYELQLNNFPKGFNYYAGGHIHQRILKPVNNNIDCPKEKNGTNSVFAYSGSTEIRSYDEYRDYENDGKGFYLVDMSGGDFDKSDVNKIDIKVHKIDIKCRDFIIDKRIEDKDDFESFMDELNSKSNPVVISSVVKEFFGHLHSILAKKALYSRLSISEPDIENAIIDIQNKNMDELFKEFLKSKNYDIDFVYGIYNEVLNDKDLYSCLDEYFKKIINGNNAT